MASLIHLKLFSVLVFYILSSLTFSPTTETTSTSSYYNCTSKIENTYQFNQNLWKLFSILILKASDNHGFFNTTISGERNKRDNIVYGLFMCNGYTKNCRECVRNSIGTLKLMCSSYKKAIIWTDGCMVRYSNRFFFNTMEESPSQCVKKNEDYEGQLVSFNKGLSSLLEDLLTEASEAPIGSLKFALNITTISEDMHLFGFAQCIPNLSKDNCTKCLGDAMDCLQTSCARGKLGGTVLYPSCIVRYDHYPFFTLPTGKRKNINLGALATVVFFHAFVLIVFFSFGCCMILIDSGTTVKHEERNCGEEIIREMNSLQIDLSTIKKATNKFSEDNKIGEGGFGAVYKGMLHINGHDEIAVKRLKKNSSQGDTEFKKEVLLISKLQHRNLVRLLGFCMEKNEKILIYEFVHNKSLDYYLFNRENHRKLSWSERYGIIRGIARGILYLHQDSHLNIVHCDLKPSNILLDEHMNAKISDFGLARIISIDQMQGNTSIISGTYGYMSPEYAMRGQFSDKSDIFSFGVIILETISGKRNVDDNEVDFDDLLSHAWKKWKGSKPKELLDPTLLEHSFSESEISRCIRIGLLCVQGKPDQRPSMATILSYLNYDPAELPLPQEPAYFMPGKAEIDDG